jgi:hypothetical protein
MLRIFTEIREIFIYNPVKKNYTDILQAQPHTEFKVKFYTYINEPRVISVLEVMEH